MRDLVRVRGGLWSLQWGTRFVYTLFLAFCVAGYAVMVALALARSGVSTEGIATYYRGDDAGLAYPKTDAELLELTHFHLFSMPLMLFVQGHLFLMTSWPRRLKTALVVAGAVGIAIDLAAPWLILHGSAAFAPAKNVGRVLMGAAFTAFAVVPLWEMWFVRRPGANGPDADQR
jgi:hypothetical protein